MVVLQMIFMEQVQKVSHPLRQAEGKDKTNKIDILYKTNLKNVINIDSSLIDVLHCQLQTQNNKTCALQSIQQLKRDYSDDSLIDDIPTFDGNVKLYFIWILKLENTVVETKWNPNELVIRKGQRCNNKVLEIFSSRYKLEQW